jgi:hypothetical protein
MKLQAPEGVTNIQHNGVDVELTEDGIADVTNNPELVAALQSHGFTEVADEQPADEEASTPARAKRARR